MPILVAMELPSFAAFLEFSLFVNPHDLATSIYTRDDRKLQRARRMLGGMLKENDGTDSALEWEEFGASTIGGVRQHGGRRDPGSPWRSTRAGKRAAI